MKLNGYRASHRNRWFLIKNHILTDKEFLLFEYYLDGMDFDVDHDKFGCFEFVPTEITQLFGKEEETIKTWHNSLLDKGFIELTDRYRHLFRVKTPTRYILKDAYNYAKEEKDNTYLEFLLQSVCFSPEKIGKNPREDSDLVDDKPKDTPKALGSFKDSSGIGNKREVVIKQKVRSEEEYQQIYNDSGYTNFTPEDMKWVDQNVQEKIEKVTKKQDFHNQLANSSSESLRHNSTFSTSTKSKSKRLKSLFSRKNEESKQF